MQVKHRLQKGSLYTFIDGRTIATTLLHPGIMKNIFYRFLEITESSRQVKGLASI